jgi:hypothetical protein
MTVFAVNDNELAMPAAFVVAVHVVTTTAPGAPVAAQTPPAAKNVPPAPVVGEVKVTTAPEIGLPVPSVTRTDNGVPLVPFVMV